MKTKKDRAYSCRHVQERLLERCNVSMSINEYDKLCQNYIDKKVKINNIESDQVMFTTSFKGKKILFVWSNKRNLITTALRIV